MKHSIAMIQLKTQLSMSAGISFGVFARFALIGTLVSTIIFSGNVIGAAPDVESSGSSSFVWQLLLAL